MQFYPADWLANPNLRRCSPAARGVWMDVLCLLHDAETYGLVRWPLKDLAQAVGAQMAHVRELVTKGVLKGSDTAIEEAFTYTPRHSRRDGVTVELVPAQPGPIWYCSRMVRDEHVRNARAPSAAPEATPDPAPKPPIGAGFGAHPSRARPSSSSSSSFSVSSTENITVLREPHLEGAQSPEPSVDLLGASASPPPRRRASGSGAGRGSRLPASAALKGDWADYAASKGMDRKQIEVEFEKFANYWWSCAGQKGVKQDWDATWRNWIMNSISNGGRNARSGQGQTRGGFRNGFVEILNEGIAGRDRDPDDLACG